jgi:hypothetical protein
MNEEFIKSVENFIPNLFDTICTNESVQNVVLKLFDMDPEFYFKRIHSFTDRQLIFEEIHAKHPGKIPIIVETQNTKKPLKFLMDSDEVISTLLCKIRQQCKFCTNKSIFLMTDTNTVVMGSQTIGDVYRDYLIQRTKDCDNILYLMVYNENTFG